MLLIVAGGWWTVGCGGSATAPVSSIGGGIPEGEFELFADIIHKIESTEMDIAAFGQARNFPAQREAKARLRQHQTMLDVMFVQKYRAEEVVRWRKTLVGADVAYAKMQEERLRGDALLERFKALGAKGELDAEGYIISLDCRNVEITEELINQLTNCSRLRSVNLSRTQLRDRHCKVLGQIRSLTEMDLSDNPLRGHHLSALKDLGQLERLDLSGTDINDLTLPEFETLEHLKTIHDLNVRNTNLNNDSCQRLTRLFRQADVRF